MRSDYRSWLERQKYDAGTITAQLHRVGRVEEYHGDLDEHLAKDRLEGILQMLHYSMDDQREGRPNPSSIPFRGDTRTNLASYKNAVALYRRFTSDFSWDLTDPEVAGHAISAAEVHRLPDDELGAKIGLERDMQAALRRSIDQLEEGLVIIDEGAERSVNSGFIDITARDTAGGIVVIELKTGTAGQRAIAQILSYMGDICSESAGVSVRGILVAAAFDSKAKAAALMVPTLTLRCYGVRFQFSEA